MTTTLREILSLLEATLEPWRFQDYCPNGLQVEGRAHVRRVVSGVTASAALIDAAIDRSPTTGRRRSLRGSVLAAVGFSPGPG